MIRRISPRVIGVQSQVVDVDWHLSPGDEHLQLLVVEHLQPIERHNVGYSLFKGVTLRTDLLVQLVIGHQVDVLYPVVICHGNIRAARLELVHSSLAQLVRQNRKVQAQIGNVASVALQVQQIPASDRSNC